MDEKYYINIVMPIDRDNMISEIKSLKKFDPKIKQKSYRQPNVVHTQLTTPQLNITNKPKTKVVSQEDQLSDITKLQLDTNTIEEPVDNTNSQILFSSLITKKKKKKKHGKLNATLMTSGSIVDFSNEQDSYTDEDNEVSNLLDVDDIMCKDSDDDIEYDIINEQKRGYDKLKKQDENLYKKEFAEEFTLLYALLKEVSTFSQDLEKKYRQMEDAKVRGNIKFITELAQAVLSSKQSKLSVLKEIANIKKLVADFKFKADTKAKESENSNLNSNDRLASAYLSKIHNYGRGNFIQDYKGSINTEERDVDKEDVLQHLSGNFINKANEEDKYDRLIEERLYNMDTPFRSRESDKYIEYENLGVKIYIKKCVDTGEWDFIALDKNSQQIYDYPVPSRRDAGRVKFSQDGNHATDISGRSYKVIEYNSPIIDED